MNINAKKIIKLRLESLRAGLSKDSKIIFLASIFMRLLSFEYCMKYKLIHDIQMIITS